MPQRGRKEATTPPKDAPPQSRRAWLVCVAVGAMLAWYYVSAQSAAATKGIAFDELLHLTGGYSYWRFGDFRLHGENGNLPQRWATLPLLFGDTHFPDLPADEWRMPSTQTIGDLFLFGSGNDVESMLRRSRAMIGLLGGALGLLIFISARSLLGTAPALVSLALFAFCPSMLAHGALTTSDMATTLFFTAAVLGIWRLLYVFNWRTLAFSSLMLGCLFVSKFSAILIAPMGAVMLAIRLASAEPTLIAFWGKTRTVEQRHLRLLLYVAAIAIQAIIVSFVIWSSYNFRYGIFTTKSDGDPASAVAAANVPTIPWDNVLDKSKLLDRLIAVARDAHLLPEAYLFGFSYVLHNAGSRPAFLNGEYRVHGWPQFFPYCVLAKTPVTLFVLMSLAAAWIARAWYAAGETWRAHAAAMTASLYRTAPLWTLFVVYWIFAITSHLNIGHRHVLPTYPPMLILAGCAWYWVADWLTARQTSPRSNSRDVGNRRQATSDRTVRLRPLLAGVVLACIASFAAESLLNWPNYLAYFNQTIGSHTNAYRHLVDSSLEWGQDLSALKRWLDEQGINDESSYLSYFGSCKPEYYGIRATVLPGYWDSKRYQLPEPLKPGVYCFSATMLQNLYTKFPGRWSRDYEASYQKLAANVRRFALSSEEGRNQLMATDGQSVWNQLFQLYEQARLARLTSFLRQREPDAQINYAILVYRLDAIDLERAANGPPVELLESSDFND